MFSKLSSYKLGRKVADRSQFAREAGSCLKTGQHFIFVIIYIYIYITAHKMYNF